MSSIPEEFTHEFLSKILNLYDPNLKLISFDLKRGASAGDNYMSIIYSLTLSAERTDGSPSSISSTCNNCFEIPLVLKALPTNPPILKYMRELKAFEKEVVMFEEVFPELCENLKYGSLPKAIYASCENEASYIIMEDLKSDGYRMADRINGLDYEHAKLTITEMSKFHALSYIKFCGDGKKILDKFPNLVDMFWVKPDDVTDRNRMFINGQIDGVKKVMEENDRSHVIPRIERLFSDVFERMHRLANIPENFPAVINFGDCWTNNIMFKYDEQGNLTGVKFLDFQLARVTSRCSDLAYLLYTSLNMSILNEKLTELLRIYHDAFTTCVKSNSASDDDDVSLLRFNEQELSFEFLQMEFEHYRSHGTTLALIYTPLMLPSFEAVPDLRETTCKIWVPTKPAPLQMCGNPKQFERS